VPLLIKIPLRIETAISFIEFFYFRVSNVGHHGVVDSAVAVTYTKLRRE
jgi:hypothetical protein